MKFPASHPDAAPPRFDAQDSSHRHAEGAPDSMFPASDGLGDSTPWSPSRLLLPDGTPSLVPYDWRRKRPAGMSAAVDRAMDRRRRMEAIGPQLASIKPSEPTPLPPSHRPRWLTDRQLQRALAGGLVGVAALAVAAAWWAQPWHTVPLDRRMLATAPAAAPAVHRDDAAALPTHTPSHTPTYTPTYTPTPPAAPFRPDLAPISVPPIVDRVTDATPMLEPLGPTGAGPRAAAKPRPPRSVTVAKARSAPAGRKATRATQCSELLARLSLGDPTVTPHSAQAACQ